MGQLLLTQHDPIGFVMADLLLDTHSPLGAGLRVIPSLVIFCVSLETGTWIKAPNEFVFDLVAHLDEGAGFTDFAHNRTFEVMNKQHRSRSGDVLMNPAVGITNRRKRSCRC